jgi:non-heme chloroperoxidase
MGPLSERGLRCIATDRRGHGRSDDPGRGHDFDTFADDLAATIHQLHLRDVTLVAQSMGCGEVARHLSRHDAGRIRGVMLVSPALPYLLQAEDNPQGAPPSFLDAQLQALQQDRPRFAADLTIRYLGLGSTWPGPPLVSSELCRGHP